MITSPEPQKFVRGLLVYDLDITSSLNPLQINQLYLQEFIL